MGEERVSDVEIEFSVRMGGLGVEITVPGRVSALRQATACMDSGFCDPRGWNSGFGLTESPGGREFGFSQPRGENVSDLKFKPPDGAVGPSVWGLRVLLCAQVL